LLLSRISEVGDAQEGGLRITIKPFCHVYRTYSLDVTITDEDGKFRSICPAARSNGLLCENGIGDGLLQGARAVSGRRMPMWRVIAVALLLAICALPAFAQGEVSYDPGMLPSGSNAQLPAAQQNLQAFVTPIGYGSATAPPTIARLFRCTQRQQERIPAS
jgi:hypothetical protein